MFQTLLISFILLTTLVSQAQEVFIYPEVHNDKGSCDAQKLRLTQLAQQNPDHYLLSEGQIFKHDWRKRIFGLETHFW